MATLDRRVYQLISDDWAPGGDDEPDGLAGPPVVLAVSLSVPPSAEADLAAWYAGEHIPALLKVLSEGAPRIGLVAGQRVGRRASAFKKLQSRIANGARNAIAGVRNSAGNVLGMMPHPERAAEAILGNEDGRRVFESLIGS